MGGELARRHSNRVNLGVCNAKIWNRLDWRRSPGSLHALQAEAMNASGSVQELDTIGTMNRGIPLGQWSGSDATNQLRETIEVSNRKAEKQTQTMVRLTWAIVVLTIVMIIVGAAQVWTAVRQR